MIVTIFQLNANEIRPFALDISCYFLMLQPVLARNCYYITCSKDENMRKPTIRQVKKVKAVFGVITAVFSLTIAIQQMIHLKKGKTAQA
jgi:hypothetical protein